MNPKVCTITATKGRHKCVERLVRCMLDQTYENCVHLIYNNSYAEQRLNNHLSRDKFILINNFIDLKTDAFYTSLGAIYRDAMTFVPKDVEVINFADDDDLFLPNHIEEGVHGLLKGGKKAYKPRLSFYKTHNMMLKMNNTLEPSIFVERAHVDKYGFSDTSTPQHLQWVEPLIWEGQIFEDPEGMSTLIYDWSQEIPTYKTSGDPDNINNFSNYDRSSKDEGDFIITPISTKELERYFKTNKHANT